MRCPKFEENRNISRSKSSLLLVELLVAMEKSKTQRGNFSTTYPNLLTPMKKIYFPVKFFAKLRKSCNRTPDSSKVSCMQMQNFQSCLVLKGFTVDYARVEKCHRHCRTICLKTICLFISGGILVQVVQVVQVVQAVQVVQVV